MKKPLEAVPTGRDTRGRFLRGNRFARGNPIARKMAILRTTLLEAVTEDDLRAVVAKLIERAKAGDIAAVKELLDRTLGRPSPGPPLDEQDATIFRAAIAMIEARHELRRQAGRDYVGIDNERLTAEEAAQAAEALGVPLPPPERWGVRNVEEDED